MPTIYSFLKVFTLELKSGKSFFAFGTFATRLVPTGPLRLNLAKKPPLDSPRLHRKPSWGLLSEYSVRHGPPSP